MSTPPQPPSQPPAPTPPPPDTGPDRSRRPVHEVTFVSYPKLLFVWPIILLGYALWPLAYPPAPAAAPAVNAAPAAAPGVVEAPAAASTRATSGRLEVLGWIYLWTTLVVLLAIGVDIDRNHAAFWILLVGVLWLLGLWLRDAKHFTLFGEIYRWFADLNLQYDRALGLTLSILLSVPYAIMLVWARLNDRWRITHNEFEHYSFGKSDDSLGRGAKMIRSDFPDVFELLLGLSGTLIVLNATGTRELRRIPHVLGLPIVRRKLNTILERTAVTGSQSEEEEEETQP